MVRKKIEVEYPSILMIQETKKDSNSMEKIMDTLWKGNHSVFVDALGASEGLIISWNPRYLSLSDFLVTKNSILASFHLVGTDIRGFITNFYGL